ncbi:hypothetical protein BH09MYX1_BH09MYX1_18720 [soil metagenome]
MGSSRGNDMVIIGVLVGVLLLAAGIAGAGFLLVFRRSATVSAGATPPPPPPTEVVVPLISAPPPKDVTFATPTATTTATDPTASATETSTATGASPFRAAPKGGGTPKLLMGSTTVSGRLPVEVIQRIVRQNYGRFRLCYELGLKTNPALEGRVSVRFVIGTDGSVSTAVKNAGDTTLPDESVISCIVRGFSNLSFPQPESGIVSVVYPLNLSPGA